MIHPDDAFAATQRCRFTRENAHLYVRHDAKLFMQPAAYERWLREREAKAAESAPNAECEAELKAALQLKVELAEIKAEIKYRQFLRKLHHWLTQPRVPAGNSEGGQWTTIGGRSHAMEFSAQRRSRADGHHYVPGQIFRRLPPDSEARKVFEEAKTGALYDSRSNRYDAMHRRYNEAVGELFDRFLVRNGVQIEQMTADQARTFVREVLESQDPRIRNLNMLIQMRELMRRVFRRLGRAE